MAGCEQLGSLMENLANDNVISITIPISTRAISPMTQYASVVAQREVTPWFDITRRYDVRSMTGPQTLMFAIELIDEGVDAVDALGVIWPINNRNLLEKIGRAEYAPKIDNWYDVERHLKAQRDAARRNANFARVSHFDRLIELAAELGDAA